MFPHIFHVWLFTHTQPQNDSHTGNHTIHVERFGAGMLLPLCLLLSEWCMRFGAGMLVPLEWRCKLLVQGVLAVRVVCTVWSGHAGERMRVEGAA